MNLTKIKELLKTYWRQVVILGGVATIGIIITYHILHRPTPITDISEIGVLTPTKTVIINGEPHTTFGERSVSKEAMAKKYDSLAKLYKVKPKTVTVTVTKIDTIYRDVVTTVTDTTVEVLKEDKNIRIRAVAFPTYPHRSFIEHYVKPDTLTRTHGVKKRLFKPDEILVFDHHTNDLFQETHATSTSIIVPKTLVEIAPFIGADFLPILWGKPVRFSAGIAVIPSVLSIKIKQKK